MNPEANDPEQMTPQEVQTPTEGNTLSPEPKSKRKIVRTISIVFGVIIIICSLFVWWGSKLSNQKEKDAQLSNEEQQSSTSIQRQDTIGNFKFPGANYKDFTITKNSDSLNTAKASPNLTEYGAPHLEITKDNDGFSEVSLPLLGIELSIPFGWGSKGGFDTMERTNFFPAPTQSDLKKAIVGGTAINLGVKVLNSSQVATNFKGVFAKVQEMTGNGQSITTEVDEQNHVFLIKIENINNPDLVAPSSVYSIYMQDPNPNSTAWVEMDIRAPKSEFQKYLGLLGLVYKDIKINWSGLDAYMKSVEQQ